MGSSINNYTLAVRGNNTKLGWISVKFLSNIPQKKTKVNQDTDKKTITSNSNTQIERYEILNKKLYRGIKALISVRIYKRLEKKQIKKIAFDIKRKYPFYPRYFITYILPIHSRSDFAWATSHFTPELDIQINGPTEEDIKELESWKISGEIINSWNLNEAILQSKIYLVLENDELYIKRVVSKSRFNSNTTEIVNLVTKKVTFGSIRYDYENDNGEYYIVRNSGYLCLYDDVGVVFEAMPTE